MLVGVELQRCSHRPAQPVGVEIVEHDAGALGAIRVEMLHGVSQAARRALLDDLVSAAITAPSGTNSQRWTFTILPDAVASWLPGHHPDDFADPAWYQTWLDERK